MMPPPPEVHREPQDDPGREVGAAGPAPARPGASPGDQIGDDPIGCDPIGGDLTGRAARFERALAQEDVARFGALSGDDHPIHVDVDFATRMGLAGTIVQGSLLVGLMAGASTRFFREIGRPALSYGYDRLRFTGTVPMGARLVVDYRVTAHDREAGKTFAEVRVTREDGTLVAVATHVAKLMDGAEGGAG